MAYAIEATPSLKGLEATKLLKRVMTSTEDTKKIEKLDRLLLRIESYKKQ